MLKSVPVPLDHFPVNALTSKVFSFMVKKAQVEPQSDPSPRPSPTTHILDSIPESFGGNHGGQSSSDKSPSGNEGDMTLQSVYNLCISLCTQVTDQAKEIKHLKAQIKKLKKKYKPVITHHRAWMKSVSLKQILVGKKSLKSNWMQKESPLPKIDPKDKGKKKIEEEDESKTESEGILEAKKKFKKLVKDEEMARKLQEDWETKEERKRLANEEATKTAFSDEYDFIQARIEADRLLALRLQDEERESSSLWKNEQSSFMIKL
ncbi:hypothetical protein Tco_1557502 [Tanacetum coccineum]